MRYSDYPRNAAEDIVRLRRRLDTAQVPPRRTDHNVVIGTWNIRALGALHRAWTEGADVAWCGLDQGSRSLKYPASHRIDTAFKLRDAASRVSRIPDVGYDGCAKTNTFERHKHKRSHVLRGGSMKSLGPVSVRFGLVLICALSTPSCSLQLPGLTSPGSAPFGVFRVTYLVRCQECRVYFTAGGAPQRVYVKGIWSNTVSIRDPMTRAVILTATPTNSLGYIQHAYIEVDGAIVAEERHDSPARPDVDVTLSATLDRR